MDRRTFLQLTPVGLLGGCLSVGRDSRRRETGAVVCNTALPDAASTGPTSGGWPTAQHDMRNTAATAEDGPTGCPETQRSWSFRQTIPTDSNHGTHTAPVVDDGVVYHADEWRNETLLRSFDPKTGEQLWQFDNGDRRTVRKTPSIVDGVAYLVSGGLLYTVDIGNREQRWKKRLVPARKDPDLGVPRVRDGTIYVGDRNGFVFAVDATTGNQQWQFETDGIARERLSDIYEENGMEHLRNARMNGIILEPIAIADGTVYVSSWDYKLYALDATSGAEKWRYSVHQSDRHLDYPLAPAIDKGRVYVQTKDSRLFVLDAATGNELWRFNELGRASNGVSPTVDATAVYISHQRFESESYLYAINKETGKVEWRTHVVPPQVGPAVDGKTLYQTLGDEFVAFDKKTGAEKWRVQMSGATFSHPAIVNGAVFTSDTGGNIYALW